MGVLSIRLKPNFLGLLKFLNNFNWFIVFFSLINLSVCIYEDQIGKFDWRQSYVGRIKFAQFDTVSTAKKIIVATEENVLAALNLKTGQVVWRHVFENSPAGNINLLHVSEKVVTVTGNNPYLIRGWESTSGVLLWEWSVTLQNDEQAEFSEWWVHNGMLVHLLPVFGSHVEVTMYNLLTGQNRGSTSKLPAIWTKQGCVLSAPYYTCISGNSGSELLLSLDVTSNAVQIISKPLTNYIGTVSNDGNLRALDGNPIIPGFVLDGKKVLLIKNNDFEAINVALVNKLASVTVIEGSDGPMILQSWNDNKGVSIKASTLSGTEVPSVSGAVTSTGTGVSGAGVRVSAATCSRTHTNVCRALLTSGDHSMHLVQQGGRIIWSREEALANVVAAEFVDLPVSDLDAAIESEFDKEGTIWGAFSRRLNTQFHQLASLLNSIQSPEQSSGAEADPLVRDYFNLHKVIVVVTKVGKIFGIDNLSGAILWSRDTAQLCTRHVSLHTQRSATHTHTAVLTVIGRHKETGNGLLISLNPIRGTLVGEGVTHLGVQLLQATMLHTPDIDKLHALVLLDKDENVQVIPSSAAPLVKNMFIYVVNTNTAVVNGYALHYDGRSITARRTYRVRVAGGGGARVVAAATHARDERVAAPGRVLHDRSVMYYCNNPNLVLLLAQADSDCVVAVVLDVVSGSIVYSQQHRRATATSLALHTENYIAYVYYNDKHRRYEIATAELYSGASRTEGAAFSSLANADTCVARAASRVLGAPPAAAAATSTPRGITDKHVLVALTSGAIVEIPWMFLEPRSVGVPIAEGSIPYSPEVPLPAEAIINYNVTLHRIRNIYTAPSSLESTSLVLATGLDLFYTRVAPSKTFDLLKDDFDYYLITIVLIALIVATYSTKYFASRKLLKQGWK